jgi:hypothetical protein
MKVKLGEAYQPARTLRRGCNGSFSAYRPHTGHLSDMGRSDQFQDRIDSVIFWGSLVGIVFILAGLALGCSL